MTPTPDQQRQAAEARELSIYNRWLNGGRVTAADLREIRAVIGEEHYTRSMQAIGEAPEPLPSDQPGPPSYPLGRASHQKPYSEYEQTFSTGERQLKRYAKKGRESDPPDPPPFDQPGEFADWFARHYPHRTIPKKYLVLKLDAATGKTSAPAANFEGMDISGFTLQKGATVEMATRYVAACDKVLRPAYEKGDDATIRLWQPRFFEAMDALRKAEASERQAAKIRGDLIPKSQIFSDLAELLETQRSMKELAGKRVRAALADLVSPEIADRIELAVNDEMERHNSVLRQLPGFQTREAFQLALAAS